MSAANENIKSSSSSVDIDPQETREWQDALSGVIRNEGDERAHYLIEILIDQARAKGIDIPYSANTEYINTIPVTQQPKYPGNPDMEIKIHSYIRWNAMAMSYAPTSIRMSVATLLLLLRRRLCMTSAFPTSGMPRQPNTMVT